MKKNFIYVCMLFASFVLLSCSNDMLMYSCGKEVNAWTKKNMTDIRQMERSQWLDVGDVDYQRAAYRAFTPEQRQSLWTGKFKEILNNIIWTQQEAKHIEYMLVFIIENINLFDEKNNQENMDKIEIELYKWKEYAIEELGWTPELLYGIIYTPQSMNADRQIVTMESTIPRLRNSNEDCNCNGSFITEPESSAGYFACSILTNRCKTDSGCKETTWGCGELWWYKCNGTCVKKS